MVNISKQPYISKSKINCHNKIETQICLKTEMIPFPRDV